MTKKPMSRSGFRFPVKTSTKKKPAKRRAVRKNSTVRMGNPCSAKRRNGSPKYHLEQLQQDLRFATKHNEGKGLPRDSAIRLESRIAENFAAVLNDPRRIKKDIDEVRSLFHKTEAALGMRIGKITNPRRHIPKLKGRGRPAKTSWWRYELIGAGNKKLGVQIGKGTREDAFRTGKKLCKEHGCHSVVVDGPRKTKPRS